MTHRESHELILRLHLSAEFPDEYEGDDDGGEWLRRWQSEVRPALIAAAIASLRKPGWRVYPVSRGASPDREIELQVERHEPSREGS
ncbi:MAG: hypothetical protein IT379_36300 [Deltaproteobacteria bacterium]|nr:hypothetical protein [Deltaproteobacteria bacterium]